MSAHSAKRFTVTLLFICAVLVFGTGHETASAKGARDPNVAAAAKWGLLGAWKVDCDKPTSGSNWNLKYVVRKGRLYHDRDSGKSRDSHRISKVIAREDGILELTVHFRSFNQTRHWGLARGKDGRIRAVFNRNVKTNEYTIKDGKFVNGGATPPWQTRCS